jgi:3-methyladenine DNA glycosylase AlkD
MKELKEIRKILLQHAGESKTTREFVPTIKKFYGIKIQLLDELAKKYSYAGFKLVEKLWESEIHEEQILAAKILGRICREGPEETLKLVRKFANKISDWAVCDTLGTQGIRKIAKSKQKEIFNLSQTLIKSKNFWKRRFALVLLINFTKRTECKPKILEILGRVENDKEHYVKKAVKWVKRCLGER